MRCVHRKIRLSAALLCLLVVASVLVAPAATIHAAQNNAPAYRDTKEKEEEKLPTLTTLTLEAGHSATWNKHKSGRSYKSANPKVAIVTSDGKITAQNITKKSTVQIIVTEKKKEIGIISVTVTPPKKTKEKADATAKEKQETADTTAEEKQEAPITMYPAVSVVAKQSVKWGGHDKSFKYESSDTKVATMSSDGKISGKKVGKQETAIITVKDKKSNEIVGKLPVVVVPKKDLKSTAEAENRHAAEGIVLVAGGATGQIHENYRNSHYEFTSQNTAIARVNADGVVTPLSAGSTHIIFSQKGKEVGLYAEVFVVDAPASIASYTNGNVYSASFGEGSAYSVTNARDPWENVNDIINSYYGAVAGISTIAAALSATICFFVMMFSKNSRAVDDAISWLKRILISWLAIILLDAILLFFQSAVSPLSRLGYNKWAF